jgi:hypothetical protein
VTGVTHRIAVGLTLALLVAVASAQQLRDPTRPPGGAAAPKADTRAGPRKQSAIVLQTILIGNDRQTAVISGRVMSVGDKISGLRLIEIREGEVVLKGSKGTRVLRLYPGVEKSDPQVAKSSTQRGAVR